MVKDKKTTRKKLGLSAKAYENKINYSKKYTAVNYKRYTLNVRIDDIEVINKLAGVNKSEYITRLIREDIKRGSN